MIREATIDDIPRLVEMAGSFHEYAVKDKGFPFHPPDFVKYLVYLMETETTTVLVLENGSGEAVGSIAGTVSPWFMDFSVSTLSEHWWWVDPEHRKGNDAMGLVEALAEWGRAQGASHLVMASIVAEREETVKAYYERKGYTYMETHFHKEL